MIITKSKRIINTDDISDILKDEIEKIKTNPNVSNIQLNPELKKELTEINNKINDVINLQDLITEENQYLNMLKKAISVDGDFFIEGKMMNIPAITGDYTITFNYDSQIYLSGICVSMSGWKPEDTWSLQIDKNDILSNICTKEIGENKQIRSIKLVNINKNIDFIFHNTSGNSRQIWCDLQYIK